MPKYTRDTIVDALFELANEFPNRSNFSMIEIAQKAGVSRQAIYQKHFRNTDEIIEYIHHILDQDIAHTYLFYKDLRMSRAECVADYILPLIYKKKEWIRILYATQLDPKWKSFLLEAYTKYVVGEITVRPEEYGLSAKALTKLIVNFSIDIIEAWITEKNPLTPEEFKPMFLKIVSSPITDLLARV